MADAMRGGHLTMAGPLTITALPFRTSPVKRGAWLLETIAGGYRFHDLVEGIVLSEPFRRVRNR
jgi:hypothetical protein